MIEEKSDVFYDVHVANHKSFNIPKLWSCHNYVIVWCENENVAASISLFVLIQ